MGKMQREKENAGNGCGHGNAVNMDMKSEEHLNTAARREMQQIVVGLPGIHQEVENLLKRPEYTRRNGSGYKRCKKRRKGKYPY